VFAAFCPFAKQFCVPKAKDRLKREIRAKGERSMATKRSRKTSKRTVIQRAEAIDATSDVTKLVNLRKRVTWADHLRQIGAERLRRKWLRARAIVATPNAAAMWLDASYEP
jgi:hypothetical protein